MKHIHLHFAISKEISGKDIKRIIKESLEKSDKTEILEDLKTAISHSILYVKN